METKPITFLEPSLNLPIQLAPISIFPIPKRRLRFEKTANTHRATADGWKPRATREVIIAGQSFELIVRFRYDSVPIPWCVAVPLAAPNNM